MQRDFRQAMSYGDYLRLDLVLSAQQPLSDPPRHDETAVHHPAPDVRALAQAHAARAAGRPRPASRRTTWPRHSRAWPGSSTSSTRSSSSGECSPLSRRASTRSSGRSCRARRASSRGSTGRSSSSSATRTRDMLQVFDHDPSIHGLLTELLEEPSLYEEFLRFIARRGHDVPAHVLDRDVTRPGPSSPTCVPTFARIYQDSHELLAGVRGLRGPRRRRGQLPALAIPAPEDRGAHHRLEDRHRWIHRCPLPAQGPRPHLLP